MATAKAKAGARARARAKAAAKPDSDAPSTTRLSLALQGGGAHGAMTWGVLDRLLEEPGLEVAAISGTSAGAVNGALLAYGLETGGARGARKTLKRFWRHVAALSSISPLQPSAFDRLFGGGHLEWSPAYWTLDLASRLFSPYDFNAFNVNPVRETLARCVDFERLHARADGPRLFVSATHVRSGRVKLFRDHEVGLDAVLASTCLPFMHKAVEVDGEAYWDGGYLGNPAILPLYTETDCRDVVVVQVNPLDVDSVPTSAQAIFDRMNTITFNAGMIRELQAVETLSAQAGDPVRLHRIHADADMRAFGPSSKLNADWHFLSQLRELGRATAETWLAEHRPALGHHATLAPDAIYL